MTGDRAQATGRRLTDTLVIAPRFCGPPDCGNGGYVSGLVATQLAGPAEVTLRKPTPLGTPLDVRQVAAGRVHVLHDDVLIAEGTQLADYRAVELPEPISLREARAAGAGAYLRSHPQDHPFPGCFVCGVARAPGDGLGVLVGRATGRQLSADVWCPDAALATSDGADSAGMDSGPDRPGKAVAEEFVWAALDCASGIGAMGRDAVEGPPYVLGRFSAQLIAPVTVNEPHIVAGWRLEKAGRQLLAASAVFTASGQPAAVAYATWIRLRA